MKVALGDRIRTTVEIRSGFQVIETGTVGVVFDTHDKPDRSYLIDLGADSDVRYTVLFPGEFEVTAKAAKPGCPDAEAAEEAEAANAADPVAGPEADKPAKASPVPATASRR
ncbi:hypothetical protein SAMN05421678_102496 [Actinopolymorpha cephalotaxi]|uniref:Uncharacterized protein n=1 Tax=Actinopolymorpha cephalotaxi TaxID=504797 RepID=A0A1I2ME89_9ACTN|nr:hypothetical protein [Actinopolymorpha cephalotaxi]NYH81633.1 hypothetical protein [Actinopolymorpha cephalotaxi]SFF87686.1 hypothetical protein SAMN05421678_102496 [Actinopolymorpha cephalotaxi]